MNGGGRWKQGPWWIPPLFAALILTAITTAPETTGRLAHAILHGGVTAAQTATNTNSDSGQVKAQQISFELPTPNPGPPSPQTGPPATWQPRK